MVKSDREKLKMHNFIYLAIVLLGGVCLLLSEEIEILLIIGLLLMAGGIWYLIRTQRCPHCDSSLMGVRFIPEFCPHCGKKIE